MRLQVPARTLNERAERDRRLGLEPDPTDELENEFEFADRIAEYASLPAGDPGCRAAARRLLGHDDRAASTREREPQLRGGGARPCPDAIESGPTR